MRKANRKSRSTGLPADHYVRFRENVTFQRTPTFGSVIDNESNTVIAVNREAVAFLSECDGMRTAGEILARRAEAPNRPSDVEICKGIVEVVNLAVRGLLVMEPKAKPFLPTLAGDPNICYPSNLQVELTTACNLECGYCYRRLYSDQKEDRLPTGRLLELLAELHHHGMRVVELTGGEPFAHPDFHRVLRFCLERFTMIGILTNGTMITERFADEMAPYRSRLTFSTSVDGSTPEIHDRRRGMKGAFELTTRAVRILSERGLRVRVSMATDEETWDDVEPTLLLSQRLGAFAFAYSSVMPFGRGKRNYRLWNRDQRAVFETDQRLKFQYKEFIHVLAEDSIVDLELPGGCGAGHRSYAMDPSGRIRPCVTFDEGMAIYGSVETHSLAELFQNELVDAFANVIPPHQEICGSCQYRLFCQGCALRALVGAQWLGEEQCAWLHDPANRHWTEMVKKYSVSPA